MENELVTALRLFVAIWFTTSLNDIFRNFTTALLTKRSVSDAVFGTLHITLAVVVIVYNFSKVLLFLKH
jgi:hypothetical protein